MSTRTRAIISTTIFTLLFLASLTGLFRNTLLEAGVEYELTVELLAGLMLSLILFGLTAWTLYFKRDRGTIFTVMLFPSVTIFPYLVFSDTVIRTFLGFEQLPAVVAAVIGCWISTYLLILTANVLNGAALYNIPLGQAGKAAQFVASLISAYFLIAFTLSNPINILLQVILIASFVFYWSYSTIWLLQQSHRQTLYAALSIGTIIALLTLVFSVWPLQVIYVTVVLDIFFYIMLNVALENRHRIGQAFWVEYIILVIAVLLILGLFAEWGVEGALLQI